jgi:UPF0716 protein FxsA
VGTVLAPLVLLFVLVPILELFVIIQVGQAIGAWWTIALLVAGSILGSLLMRAQGRAVWRRFNEALRAGRPPATEVADGALVIFGGALLLTPGFATDTLGLALLFPPTRALVRRVLVRRIAAQVASGAALRFAAFGPRPGAPGPGPRGGARSMADFDVDGTATDVRPDPPRTLP